MALTAELAKITPEVQGEFDANGVVKVCDVIGSEWIERFLADAQRQLDNPGAWVTDTNPGAATNRLFTTRYRWETNTLVRDFIKESPIAMLAGQLAGSPSMRFYFDHLLIKEPQTPNPTPWHQDIGYWPFLGRQIVSAWVPMTAATVDDSSLEFVKGSHNWNAYYAPESFDGKVGWTAGFEGEKMPDIQAAREQAVSEAATDGEPLAGETSTGEAPAGEPPYEIIGFDVEPGDVIFFSAWTLHWSPGNAGDRRRVAFSTRWLGEDATWFPHAGCDPTVTQEDTTAVPGEYPADDDRFPLAFAAGTSQPDA